MATTAPGAIIQMRVEGADSSQRQIETVSQSMNRLSDTVQAAQSKLAQMAAAVGIGSGLTYIIAMSDQYTKFTAQLRLATQSQAEYGNALAEVKRISSFAQSSMGETGTLFARISNGTRELGVSQKQVADITETVSLALKVSGATAQESASAMLQLSQSFASGTLRGEEFNAVNEAAPRLMKALADGMGVPVGALKDMASNGQITSQVMAETLPKALETLRDEAKKIQTISGALQVLKDRAMEFTAVRAQENGMVAALTSGIGLLADNLVLVTGALSTLTAVKLVTWLDASVTKTMADVAAKRALIASNLATAESDVASAATASLLATARLNELRATILAAEGNIQLELTTNGLIPAQARQLAMTEALEVKLLELAAAQRAASTTATAGSAVMAALGGPLGLIVTALGVAATAWMWYSSKSEEANRNASATTESSTQEIVENLEKQNVKLRERLALQQRYDIGQGTASGGPEIERLAEFAKRLDVVAKRIKDAQDAGREVSSSDWLEQVNVQGMYDDLKRTIDGNKALRAEVEKSGTAAKDLLAVRQRLAGVNQQYLDDLAKLQNAYEKGAITQKEYVALVSQLANDTWKSSEAGKEAEKQSKSSESANKKQSDAYRTLIDSIKEKTAANQLELLLGENATDSQKNQIKLDQQLESGKRKLTSAAVIAADAQARLAIIAQASSEQALKEQAAQRDVTKFIVASTIARDEAAKSLVVEGALYLKTADARDLAMIAVRAQADTEKKLSDMREAKMPVSDQIIEQLNAEEKARVLVMQSIQGQTKAYGYAGQLAEENKKFAAEAIFDEKERAAALLSIAAQMWQERIRLAGAGTAAQKALQEQYDTWYRNQSIKPALEEQRKMWESIESAAHDAFLSLVDSSKSGFQRVKDSAKAILFDWLYQMTVKKWVINIGASVGLTGDNAISQLASGTTGGKSGSGDLISAAQTASSMYKAISGGFTTISTTVADAVQVGLYETGLSSELLVNGAVAKGVGTLASAAAAYAAGSALNSAVSGKYSTGSGVMTAEKVATAVASYINPVLGVAVGAISGLVNRAFGMGNTELKSQGITGTLSASGLTGNSYQNLHQDGGWFRSDKNWTDKTAFSAEMTAQFTQGFDAIKAASAGFATSVGASVDSLAAYSKTFDIKLTSDAAANEKAISDFFLGVGDEIALRLVPGLAQFNKSGETVATTLQRLAGDFDATNQVAMLLGKNGLDMFGSLGMESAAARERLIELAGSVSTLSSQAASFNQNYLTEAERLKPVADAVEAAMASLGLASVVTREQFKTTLLALDPLDAAQAKEIASLLALQDAFAQVHPAIEATSAALRTEADILNERQDLQKRLDTATLTDAQIAAKARLAIAPTNLELYDQVIAQEQLKQATAAATDSLKSIIERLASAQASNIAYRDSLMTGSLSTLTPMQKYLETQKQYATALAKAKAAPDDASANSAAQAAATAFLTASQVVNASSSAYVSDRSSVLRDITTLADIAGAQMTDAQKQLDAATQQVTGIATLNTTALGIQEAILNLAANGPVVQAPALNLDRYASATNEGQEVLVAEIKRLNARIDDLVKATEKRSIDAERQKDEMVDAMDDVAPAVGDTVGAVVKSVAWGNATPGRQPTRG